MSEIGVIFDCDGTLLDSMGVWHSLDDRLAALVGVELTQADRDFMTRSTLMESSVYLHDELGVGESVQDVWDIIYNDMLDYYEHDAAAKPGALEFVQGLAELGVPMGIASSTSPGLLRIGLKVAGFTPYMKTIYSVDDLNTSKRERLIFDTVRAELGTDVSNTWGVEDALYAVNTLRDAGYRTLTIYDSEIAGSPAALQEASDRFIMSFTEITPEELLSVA